MDLTGAILSQGWLLLAHLIYWPLLWWAVRRAPWRFLRNGELLNVFLGACTGLLLLWHIRAGIEAGPDLHLLGAAFMTLMFGWQLAVIGMSLTLAGAVLTGLGDWPAFAVNAILSICIPIFVSYRLARLIERRLPNHFFIYIYLPAFFGSALALVSVGLTSAALLMASHSFQTGEALTQYLSSYLLLLFPEAFTTGMFMTLFVVYRPHWVVSFDDQRYLKGR